MLASVEARDFGGPAFKEYWRRQALDAVASCEAWAARDQREARHSRRGVGDRGRGPHVHGRHGPVVEESGEQVLLRVKTGKTPMSKAAAAEDPDLALSALGADADRAKYVYPRKLSYGAPAERDARYLGWPGGIPRRERRQPSRRWRQVRSPPAPGARDLRPLRLHQHLPTAHGGRTVGRTRGRTPTTRHSRESGILRPPIHASTTTVHPWGTDSAQGDLCSGARLRSGQDFHHDRARELPGRTSTSAGSEARRPSASSPSPSPSRPRTRCAPASSPASGNRPSS